MKPLFYQVVDKVELVVDDALRELFRTDHDGFDCKSYDAVLERGRATGWIQCPGEQWNLELGFNRDGEDFIFDFD